VDGVEKQVVAFLAIISDLYKLVRNLPTFLPLLIPTGILKQEL
jgi:hypothetical protein